MCEQGSIFDLIAWIKTSLMHRIKRIVVIISYSSQNHHGRIKEIGRRIHIVKKRNFWTAPDKSLKSSGANWLKKMRKTKPWSRKLKISRLHRRISCLLSKDLNSKELMNYKTDWRRIEPDTRERWNNFWEILKDTSKKKLNTKRKTINYRSKSSIWCMRYGN